MRRLPGHRRQNFCAQVARAPGDISRSTDRRVPPPAVLIPAAAAALFAASVSPDWTGFAVAAALAIGGGAAIAHWSRSQRWSRLHEVALAAGALLAVVLPSFITDPLGETAPVAKYGHNLAMTALVAALSWWAMRRAAAFAPPR